MFLMLKRIADREISLKNTFTGILNTCRQKAFQQNKEY